MTNMDKLYEAVEARGPVCVGLDSISPYLPYAEKQGKGRFVLCRTSNGGAKDFEYEKLADGRHVYDLVGDKLNALGKEIGRASCRERV